MKCSRIHGHSTLTKASREKYDYFYYYLYNKNLLSMGDIIFNKTEDDHYSVILNEAKKSDKIFIVSPFCYDDFTKFFNDIASGNLLKSISFITTLKDNEVISKVRALGSFLLEASKHNISATIYIKENLHAKIYLFYKGKQPISAIITSANVTENGLKRNYECGYRICDNSAIHNIITDLKNMATEELSADKLNEISLRVDEYKARNKVEDLHPNIPSIYIEDLLYVDYTKNRIFLKPIGCNENKIYNGDYSTIQEQRFSKKRPKAVRPGDILIVYAVGSAKIVSVNKVISEAYYKDVGDRWPWYVKVRNLTPALGRIWYTRNLFPTKLANEYVKSRGLPITYRGGKNLKSLNYGLDKLRLTTDFGKFLLNKVFAENLKA